MKYKWFLVPIIVIVLVFGVLIAIRSRDLPSEKKYTEVKAKPPTTEITSKDIPYSVLYPCLDHSGRIAEIGEAWNYSDVLEANSPPQTRLIKACQTKEHDWKIVCEEGGYTVSRRALRAMFVGSGKWAPPERIEWRTIPEDLNKLCD